MKTYLVKAVWKTGEVSHFEVIAENPLGALVRMRSQMEDPEAAELEVEDMREDYDTEQSSNGHGD